MVRQLAADKGCVYARLGAICPSENFWLQTVKGVQPEIFRWTDGTESRVDATFVGGKLVHHELFRPAQPDDEPGQPGPAAAP